MHETLIQSTIKVISIVIILCLEFCMHWVSIKAWGLCGLIYCILVLSRVPKVIWIIWVIFHVHKINTQVWTQIGWVIMYVGQVLIVQYILHFVVIVNSPNYVQDDLFEHDKYNLLICRLNSGLIIWPKLQRMNRQK